MTPEPRHTQRIGHQAGLHVRLHAPAHHLAAVSQQAVATQEAHAIGHTALFLAIQAYFTVIPWQSTPSLFFGLS
jgi:hypothetical protein